MIPASLSGCNVTSNIDRAYDYIARKSENPFEPVATLSGGDVTREVVNRIMNKSKNRWINNLPDLKFMMVTFFDPYFYVVTDDDSDCEIEQEESEVEFFDED
jgi:hypothetical protein